MRIFNDPIMPDTVFRLKKGTELDTIEFLQAQTTIEVYNLKYHHYVQRPGDLVWYGTGGDPMAFLVRDLESKVMDMITVAMKWYAFKEEYGPMDISMHDPRPPVKMRIVK